MIYWGLVTTLFFMEIKVYTSPGCFYCTQVKELFKRAELEYEESVIDETNRAEFRAKYPLAVSFPFVLIDNEPVGGLVETARILVKRGLVSAKK